MVHIKTAISLPEEVFAAVSAEANRTGRSRSALIARAIENYLAGLADEEFARRIDAVYGSPTDEERAEQEQFLRWSRRSIRSLIADDPDGEWTRS